MINDNIDLKYDLPSGEKINISVDPSRYFNCKQYAYARDLHGIYEDAYLFIPKKCGNVNEYLQEKYDPVRLNKNLERKLDLEKKNFEYIETLLDEHNYDCSFEQLESFAREIIRNEDNALNSDEMDATLQKILDSENKEKHLIKLTIQFGIEFLSEGSGMSSYVGGSYGELQSNIFRIILDEMGGGVYSDKHSHLYESTMATLNMSDDPKHYRDHFDLGTYVVSNYVYYLCQNKQYFFRFIGSLFRNEACFVNWQKQLSGVMKNVLGGDVDVRYFDVHSVVDQEHGRWAFDTIIKTAVDTYGESVIPEIIRGYIGYKLYQDLNDIEFCHSLATYDQLMKVQGEQHKKGSLLKEVYQPEKSYFIYESDVIIEKSSSSRITVTHDMSCIDTENTFFILPKYFPIWIESNESPVRIYEIKI